MLKQPGHCSLLVRAVGTCPEIKVEYESLLIRCLIETGAEVSTIAESFFFEHLAQGDEPMGISAFLKIRAPEVQLLYLGYVEMSISVMGHHFPDMGFMVVKDSHNADFAKKKNSLPVCLRM